MTEIQKAIKILKNGGIVIFPTDTAFGIGCRIDDEKAVQRLFKIRKRPRDMAVPVLVDSIVMAKNYLEQISPDVQNLMNKYWPGALTIVLSCKINKVPLSVRGGGTTIGIRISDSSTILQIIKGVGVPILGPSANFHGGKTPYNFEDLNSELVSLSDYVIRGSTSIIGSTSLLGNVSTVIDCSSKPWKILREGAIKIPSFATNFAKASMVKKASEGRQNSISLHIDSTNNEKVIIELRVDQKKYKEERKVVRNRAQVLLPMIEGVLKKHGFKALDLTSIEVNTGPGSFTGIRIGVSVANALSFSLNIPINGKKPGEFAEPCYE